MSRGRLILGAAAIALLTTISSADAHEARRTVRESVRFEGPSSDWHLVVDSIHGGIQARGVSGDTVRLVAIETIEADSQRDLDRAQGEEHLTIRALGSELELMVDEAWRASSRRHRRHGWAERGYTVRYDFELEVPAAAAVTLSTVNDGGVEVQGIDGDFHLTNVNGDVALSDARGAGRAASVNGEVRVEFADNPSADCSFASVNGRVEIALREGLSADARFQTLNGEIFTDFPFEYRSLATAAGRRENGRFLLRRRGEVGARFAGGGPELEIETVNGDIILRNRDQLEGDTK